MCRKEKSHLGRRIKYVHGLVEQSGLAAASLDAMLFHYVTHECPQVWVGQVGGEGRCREGREEWAKRTWGSEGVRV